MAFCKRFQLIIFFTIQKWQRDLVVGQTLVKLKFSAGLLKNSSTNEGILRC
ncbi:hypothetical protein FD25_GL001447 [Levilactobacillus acidifarinae DSM 19394]|uniref:Uncharacterized protein n=1 Tax=Levilactobacillus acidifarinae DSM 19394 = JCM 15949 TaxID=1423715 RepID=A0A0R1LM43_9LACO|nr:hypothetical protein FD25_GL001447 [Levilactobacillus acidifarinae DSM 19394]